MDATWPALDGNYIVGDPNARVAVCTLTDDRRPAQIAALPGVAIAGTLATANLGIERLVINVLANPAIDHLLLCGRDSSIFGPGQSLAAMARDGVDDNKRILGAAGFDPRRLPRRRARQSRGRSAAGPPLRPRPAAAATDATPGCDDARSAAGTSAGGNVPTDGTTAEPANAQATAAPGVVADGPRQAGDTAPGESVQLVIEVISTTGGQTLHGFVADPDPADPYARYVRTSQRTTARYNVLTRIAMGTAQDVTGGALLRVRGTIQADGMIDIEAMAILTHVATVITT